MKASELIQLVQERIDTLGDVDVLLAFNGAFEVAVHDAELVDYDQFDYDGPHYIVIEAGNVAE